MSKKKTDEIKKYSQLPFKGQVVIPGVMRLQQ